MVNIWSLINSSIWSVVILTEMYKRIEGINELYKICTVNL